MPAVPCQKMAEREFDPKDVAPKPTLPLLPTMTTTRPIVTPSPVNMTTHTAPVLITLLYTLLLYVDCPTSSLRAP